MKRYQFLLTLLSAGLYSLTTIAGNVPDRKGAGSDDTPYQVKTFSGTINAVRAETSGGSLTVEGGTDRNAKVEMYVRANNSRDNLDKQEIEERLREYDITIVREGSTIVATAKRRGSNNDWKRSVSISFKFYTPRAVSTDLRTSGGSITLNELSGKQRFRTSGGSLNLTDVDGDINGQTSGGSIHLDRCKSKDRMDLQTSGGSIEAKESSGSMRLHTSGGSIRLTDLRGDIDAQTSGGSVQGSDITGDIKAGTSGGSVRLANISGSVEANTSAGSVDVSIVKLGEYVRLSTSVGSVRVKMPLDKGMDLNLSGNRVTIPTSLSKFDGDIEKDRVRGRLNGGGIAVNISASNGSVYVNQ
ncbi:hypothetical protein [Spirosoma utsteinense]|uniref:Adhesin domain-containing protein n=1 Tax=Spirosoma utsteinense TaxID=2585773 RepID=A0ABR6W211_9BACT|nr:hypothetical protein [Spirosoma utsteinense]MBC3788179.1 putative protein involved in outer membrane biogenesis [Spirosoma utsteinense]MBC3790472.1 putative protein involved in outer membrane biogenesis [Spirosoma utsteinense]